MNRSNLIAALVCAGSLVSSHAAAEDTPKPPTHSGAQDAGPNPPAPEENDPEFSLRQRRAIRGCPVGMDCHKDLDRDLREFELESFPKPSSKSPWIDNDDVDGHNDVRIRGKSRDEAPGRVVRRQTGKLSPTDLRPDLPWLADLTLPDIPFRWDDRIIKYLEFYKSDKRGRRIMSAWLAAQGRYRKLIERQMRKKKMPEDLLYIAMIESSYDPHDYSRVGASGLWQFMPAGGRIYGLSQDRWVDERNDPLKSTKAAVVYFADLYQRFGDWELSMAAYNAGYGAVLRGMAKYNTNDFWQLLEYENALPWESGIYVPKAIACAIVGHNRKLFGYDNIKDEPALEYDKVTVPKSVSLGVIARAAGVKKDAVEELNPHLRRGRTPPGVKKFVVRIPKGTKKLFAERFPQLRGDWDKYDAYVVRHGERFEDVATMHGISRSKLRELNDIETEAEVAGGTVIVVPVVSEEDKKKNLAKAQDNLYKSGVPRGDDGDKLLVAVPDPALKVKGMKRVFYRVVSGDTQFGIAKAFEVDRADLAKWNGLDPEAHLHPRMVMQVWISPKLDLKGRDIAVLDESRLRIVEAGSQEHMDLAEERTGRKRVLYKAKKRESFEEIGKKYGLTARDLARINRKPHDTVLEPGETVLVYQVVDTSASKRAAKQAKQKARHTPRRNKPKRKKRK